MFLLSNGYTVVLVAFLLPCFPGVSALLRGLLWFLSQRRCLLSCCFLSFFLSLLVGQCQPLTTCNPGRKLRPESINQLMIERLKWRTNYPRMHCSTKLTPFTVRFCLAVRSESVDRFVFSSNGSTFTPTEDEQAVV